MKKAFGGFSIALLLLGLVLCAVSVVRTMQVPDLLEYTALAGSNLRQQAPPADNAADPDRSLINEEKAPIVTETTELGDQLDRLEEQWEEIDKVASARTVWGYTASATVAEKDLASNAATTAVYAIGQRYASVYPMLTLSGRLMYDDELRYGDPVAVLDEALALKLFQTTDPLDKEIVVNEQVFRVVGVIYSSRNMGDPSEYTLYLPLTAIAEGGKLPIELLTVGTVPQPAAGAYEAMVDQMAQWDARGTLNDTRKERHMTLLGIRWISGFLGVAVIIWVLKKHVGLGKRWMDQMKAGLRQQYMVRMLPGVIGRCAVWALGLGAIAVCGYFVFTYITEPILIFPEWVPAVPVEPESIYETFWNMQWANNGLMELRTPAISRLRHFATMANVGTSLCLLGLVFALARWRKKTAEK